MRGKSHIHQMAGGALCALCVATLLLCSVVGRVAYADWSMIQPAEEITVLRGERTYYLDFSSTGLEFDIPKGSVTNLKVSNKKAVDVFYQKGFDFLYLYLAKPGKCTVSYKYCGKRYKASLTIKKWKNPFKKLKIGSKNCAKGFNKEYVSYVKWKSAKGKALNIKPAKGWRIKDIKCQVPWSSKLSTLRNGKKLPKRAKHPNFVSITMEDKAGNIEEARIGFY